MAKPPPEPTLTQPHDRLFRWAFSQKQHATGLLRAALPKALAAAVDWSTLRLEKASYIDRALRERRSDLLFSARAAGLPIYFYMLIEHQRDVEALMVLRMSIYMARAWEQLVRDHPAMKQVPPIMPLLIQHSDTGWTAATAFQDIVAVDAALEPVLRPHVPRFRMRVVDLSEGQASRLVERTLTALGRVVLWCLSVAGDDERLKREIERIRRALGEVLAAPDGLAALEVLLRYLLATHRRMSVDDMGKLLEKAVGTRAQEDIVTVLDKIERRGERRGRARTLLEQMTARFGTLPADVTARVEAAGESALARWTMRVLTAPTAADVFDTDGEGPVPSTPSSRRPATRKRAP